MPSMKFYTAIIVIIVIIIVVIIKSIRTLTLNNSERHLYDNNTYAHFSKITSNTIFLYPKYIFSHPTKITLKAGEALFIPAKWHHWIYSDPNTFAVNYWWKSSNESIVPYIQRNFIDPIDLKLSMTNEDKNMIIHILDGDTDLLKQGTLNNYINKNKNNNYILTLPAFVDNDDIKHVISKYIRHPKMIISNDLHKNYNLWYNSSYMDAGLHYDDENGLLCVMHGTKNVYLYPPSDNKYLYLHNIKPSFINHKYAHMEFNIYYDLGKVGGLPSSIILYETFKDKKKYVCRVAENLYKLYGPNKIIYGIKCDITTGNIWWEYYFYNLDKYRKSLTTVKNFDFIDVVNDLRTHEMFNDVDVNAFNNFLRSHNAIIMSFEIHNNKIIKNELDFHINTNKSISVPFYGQTYVSKTLSLKSTFVVTFLKDFISNISMYAKYFDLIDLKNQLLVEINKYNYVTYISFYKKSPSLISIQWYGLTDEDYLKFLSDFNWPKHLIQCHQNNDLAHIKKEITINYDIIDNKLLPTRTSIYGSL